MTPKTSRNPRRKARELALKTLYMIEQQRGGGKKGVPDGEEETIEKFLAEHSTSDSAKEYAGQLVKGVGDNAKEIDRRITEASDHWKLERIAPIDRSILRIATYEIVFEDDVPPKVSMDEAIHIARKYSSEGSPSFVNGVLDKISQVSGED